MSQGTVAFCTQCGNAIQPPTTTSLTGRPVISMNPRKQGQVSENPSGPATSVHQPATSPQQITNIQPSQFQTSPLSKQVSVPSSNKNKIAIGAVGAIIAILAIVFLLGRNDSESPSVSPSNQQSGSSSGQTSSNFVEEYASYDDYPYVFRSAFLSECSTEGLYDACVCALEQMETLYSYDEIGIIFDSGQDMTWLYEQVTTGCI